jgi:hypothetical protein
MTPPPPQNSINQQSQIKANDVYKLLIRKKKINQFSYSLRFNDVKSYKNVIFRANVFDI